MRILHVTAHYPPDFTSGATLQVRRLATRMAAAGHDVSMLAGAIAAGLADGETRDEVVEGVRVRWIGTSERVVQADDRNWLNPTAVAAMAALLDERRPEVVHAHTLQTLGADLLTAATTRRVPTVVTMHDSWWWCPRLFLVDPDLRPCPPDTRSSPCPCARTAVWRRDRAASLGVVLHAVDLVLVPSAGMGDLTIANGLAPDRVEIDANDVDRAAMVDPARRPSHSGAVRFLYVGGDHPLKGRTVVLAAAERLRAVRPDESWRLTVHGVEGPRRRWPRRSGPVSYRPAYPPDETATVFAGADVLVIPSIARESFSLAAREALGAGIPVVTSDCLGPEEVVHDGRNGLVVPTGDDDALAHAMGRLIDEPGLLDRLRRGALADPPPLRDPDEHATTLVARYQQLRERPRRP